MNELASIIPLDEREGLEKLGYSLAELEQIETFAEPFCKEGRIFLARIFERGKLHKNSFDEIMAACQKAWEKTWKHGTPDRIGDVDDVTPPRVGMDNTDAYFYVYRWLGFMSSFPKNLF